VEFVTEWIAIGNCFDARNIKALKEARIEAVLCVADWVRMPRKKYNEAGIVSRKLPIEDAKPLPPEREVAFLAALRFVDHIVGTQKRCLIHCAAGISRSAAFIAVWLHTRKGMDYDDAIALIRSVRPIADPQPEPFASMKKMAY